MPKCDLYVSMDINKPDKIEIHPCEGDCPDGHCYQHTIEKKENNQKVLETFCSCSKSETEPTTCHLVLRQFFDDGGKIVKQCVVCRGTCPKGDPAHPGPCQLNVVAHGSDSFQGPCVDIPVKLEIRVSYRCGCPIGPF